MKNRKETDILVTWQKDSSHDKPYNEIITIFKKQPELDVIGAESEGRERGQQQRQEEEQPQTQIGNETLTPLERAIFLAILDEVQNVILIFTTAANEPIRDSWKLPLQFISPSERFLDEDKSEVYEQRAITDSQKLIKDSLFFYNIIRMLTYEIEDEGTFESIKNFLEQYFLQNEMENDVFLINLSNEQKIEMLQKQINEEREEGSKLLTDMDEGIHKLKWFLEDLIEQNRAEYKYLNSWENARNYLNGFTLHNEEKVFTDTIEEATTEIEREIEAHKQIESYIEESREDYLEDIEHWIKKYDEDLERLEDEILKLNMKYEKLVQDKTELTNLYESHRLEMQEFLEYKEEKRRTRNLLILQMQAATKIQRWWRRIMINKNLGPYKKKKGKGKNEKKK